MPGISRMGVVRLCLVAGACILGTAQTSAPPPPPVPDDGAYYVIGVFPEDTTLDVVPGTLDNGTFTPSTASYIDPGHPNSGFVVGRVPGDALLGIGQLRMTVEKTYGTGLMSLLNREISRSESGGIEPQEKFTVCGGRAGVTFHVQAHHVTYIASIAFSRNVTDASTGNGFRALSHEQATPYMLSHLDKARAFLAKFYPQLADRLEQGAYEFHPFKADCPKTE